jgi:isoquinoline 1-oxidoreductase beta subunit
MARALNADPFSFRMGMLGGNLRLAKALTAVTAIGGWDGGVPGSTMGLAAASAVGSHIALLVQAGVGPDQRVTVERMVAAVDCGRIVNPGLVRQQVEGSLLHALDLATSPAPEFLAGMAVARPLAGLGLRRLSPVPRIEVELIASGEGPGGVSGLGHVVCAAAVANALASGTGRRLRVLPFDLMAA